MMQQVQQRASEQQKVRRKSQHVSPMLAEQEERNDQAERNDDELPPFHRSTLRNRSEFPITLTELAAIAAAAMIGDSSTPNSG
jgi:hypothetical protein